MSSISPLSSASNVLRGGHGVLSPALLIEQLQAFSLTDQRDIIRDYYRACAVGAVDVVKNDELTGSMISVESTNGTVDYFNNVGSCYLRVVKREHRSEVFRVLGVEPTFQRLLDLPRKLFLSDTVLRRVRVECGFGGVHHLSDEGDYSFFEAVVLLAGGQDSWHPRSLAAEVMWCRELPVDKTRRLCLQDKLGTSVPKAVGVALPVDEVVAGGFRTAFHERLGSRSRLSLLLSCPLRWFRTRSETMEYGIDMVGGGFSHVKYRGGDVSWIRFVTYFAQRMGEKFPVDSFGSALRNASPVVWDDAWKWSSDPELVLRREERQPVVHSDLLTRSKGEFAWFPKFAELVPGVAVGKLRYFVVFPKSQNYAHPLVSKVASTDTRDVYRVHGAFSREQFLLLPPKSTYAAFKPSDRYTVVRLCMGVDDEFTVPRGVRYQQFEGPCVRHSGAITRDRFAARYAEALDHSATPSIHCAQYTVDSKREVVEEGVARSACSVVLPKSGKLDLAVNVSGDVFAIAGVTCDRGQSVTCRIGSAKYQATQGVVAPVIAISSELGYSNSFKLSGKPGVRVQFELIQVVDQYAFDSGGPSTGQTDVTGYEEI